MLCIKPLPADAGRFGRVCFDVLKYGVLIHRPACGAEITPSPEMTAPVSLLQFGKLHLDFARSASLDPPAEALGITTQTLRRWIEYGRPIVGRKRKRRGELRVKTIGGRYIFEAASDRALAKHLNDWS